MSQSSGLPSGDRRAPVSRGRNSRQRYLDALDRVLDWDDVAALDITGYVAELRRECAQWRVRVRELEAGR